jgi:hypothetical protein
VLSDPVRVAVVPFKPALFTINESGGCPAAVVNDDGSLNAINNPAPRGSYVSIYGTGGGANESAEFHGSVDRCRFVFFGRVRNSNVRRIFGCRHVCRRRPLEIGGLFQINVLIPANAPTGPAVPLLGRSGAGRRRSMPLLRFSEQSEQEHRNALQCSRRGTESTTGPVVRRHSSIGVASPLRRRRGAWSNPGGRTSFVVG